MDNNENRVNIAFLCRRIKQLREDNECTMEEMAQKLAVFENGIAPNKSSISRVESGKTSEKTLIEMAQKYCKVFGMSDRQTDQFMRGERIAIPDTSALLKNSQLIDELNKKNKEEKQLIDSLNMEYSRVVIPKVVVDELDKIKNYNKNLSQAKKAWEVLRSIGYGERTILMEYEGIDQNINNDCKIIWIAREASKRYNAKVDIITNDTDYSAYLKGDETISSIHLADYIKSKQILLNMDRMDYFNQLYLESFDDVEKPTPDEADGYLRDGYTMIIAAVRNNAVPFELRKKKIEWLIGCGADVNKRDYNRRYFPPITHAIQKNDYEMVEFLLKECKANPNVGSRDPFDSGKVRHKNEGNMPLMVAAYDGRDDIVRLLCQDERISINQQDANGFTALMKACMNGNTRCRDIIQEYNADERIVDINGWTFMDHYHEFLEKGPSKKKYNHGNKPNNKYRK